MQFRSVFIAIFLGTSIMVGALILERARPAVETERPTAQAVAATGECAECHRFTTPGIVHQYESSVHAAASVSCLDCHRPSPGQTAQDHNGFQITAGVTSANCRACHESQYDEFVKSRHALPASAAVNGTRGMTPEMIAEGERFHPGAVDRAPNALTEVEGAGATRAGCMGCHSIGSPNMDGSIGDCTTCHSRHSITLEVARLPQTCGQCHMGPDHSQFEIYTESKHGVMFNANRSSMNLNAQPSELTTADMPAPTCATCHMSGLEGLTATHDTSQRLSYWLFATISKRRPDYEQAQSNMQAVCEKCHFAGSIEKFYAQAETVVDSTNKLVTEAESIIDGLRADGLLTKAPFDEPIEYEYFNYWHYYGRTAKHGAFMGGADFVQWHGNYELQERLATLRADAEAIRREARAR